MDSLPDKKFQPDDVDEVIRNYGKPIPHERKQALMAKLEAERELFLAAQKAKSTDEGPDRGRKR